MWARTGSRACFAESCSQNVADRLFQLHTLQSENSSLRRQVTASIYQIPSSPDYPDPSSPSALKRRQSSRASRPMSMYETGSGLKPYLSKGESPRPQEAVPTLQPFPPHVSRPLPSFPLPFPFLCPVSITFLLLLLLPLFVPPLFGSGAVIKNVSHISSRHLSKAIIPHSSGVSQCRLCVQQLQLSGCCCFGVFFLLCVWGGCHILKFCTMIYVDEALNYHTNTVFLMHDNFTRCPLASVPE